MLGWQAAMQLVLVKTPFLITRDSAALLFNEAWDGSSDFHDLQIHFPIYYACIDFILQVREVVWHDDRLYKEYL